MILRKVPDAYQLKDQEGAIADISDMRMLLDYMAMMTDVELPTTDTSMQDTYHGEPEDTTEE